MADADLEEIRKARLAQLQGSNDGGSGNGAESKEDAQRQRESEARASLVSQIVTPEAADRLNRIKLVKASRAEDVENRLIMLARSGQLRGKVTEEQLKGILAAMTEQEEALKGKAGGGAGIQVVRRGADDDDELDELMKGLED